MTAAACVAFFSLAGCIRKNTPVERMAVLPANLLTTDANSEWLKIGIPIVLQNDLISAHSLISGFAPDEARAIEGGATRILRTSLENRQNKLHIETTMVDASTHKVVKVESADATSVATLLPALNGLAKKFDANATDFSTKNAQSWQALAIAETSNNPQQRAQFLNQAISQDQNFGFAWVSLVNMIAPNRQTDMKGLIEQGKAHRNAFDPYNRAKFEMAINRLSNAPAAESIKAAQAVLALAPNDLDVMAALGNYEILAGQSAAGEESLRRAVSLNPTNIGLKFQLGRALLQVRKFKEAEAMLVALDKTPAVYPELATCILLEGDKTRATGYVDKFENSVQNEDLKSLVGAAWDVMIGERQKGIDRAMNTKFKTPQIQSMALTEASVWQVMGGDFSGAQKTVTQLGQVPGPAPTLPQVAALLADKTSSAADWQKQVQNSPLPDAVKQPIFAYGFFLRGNYDDAAKVWQQVDDQSHGMDLHARAMLASSLDHLGKKSDAERIQVLPFTPEFADLYSAVSFTEMRRMVGR